MKKVNDFHWKTNKQGQKIYTDHNIRQTKEMIDQVGPGFCLAKWNQVTIHLGTGMTHSCHHPTPHKIPLEELENNPGAIHNTLHKKIARTQMLEGKRPSECDYCWRIEDNGEISDRSYKSSEYWAVDDFDKISQYSGNEDVYPTYLEVSFSNACNLKCTYCNVDASSKWYEDVKKHGPIKLLQGTSKEQWSHGWQQDLEIYKAREENPYVNAFWEWWPEAYKHLKVFRITGGEPLMSKETFRVLEWFIENPNPELELQVNTNLSVPDKLWDRFWNLINILDNEDKVKKITIYTSVEGWGRRAEYARIGLNFNLLQTRYEQIVAKGTIRGVIMATYNIFSITSIHKLFEWQVELREKYNTNRQQLQILKETGFESPSFGNQHLTRTSEKHTHVVCIDTPYLRHPTFLDAQISTHDLVDEFMLPGLDYMADNVSDQWWAQHRGFEQTEFDKFRRIVFHRLHYNKKTDTRDRTEITRERAKFYEFVNEIDKRNNTNFLQTFPEMENFYNTCKECYHGLTNV